MSVIVAFPPSPSDPNPRSTLPPVTCAPWCIDGTGHPDAVHPAEQRCRSVAHRLDTVLGGGIDCDSEPLTYASVVAQAEQAQGEPARIIIGVEVGGEEHWVVLTPPEARALHDDLHQVLDAVA